jgi:uncharacterized membrane protein YdjX (TVP38/TMEM64 family)
MRNRSSIGYMIVLGVLPMIFTSVAGGFAIQHADTIRSFDVAEWTAVYAAACFTMAFAMTPTTFVALASGFFIVWTSLGGVFLSYVGASLLGYGVARVIDGGRLIASIEQMAGERPVLERLRSGEAVFVIAARLSPFFPFAVMNVVLSALRVDIRTFLVAGLVGMLPRTLVFIWIGMQFQEFANAIREGHQLGPAQYAVAILSTVSVVALYIYIKRVVTSICTP